MEGDGPTGCKFFQRYCELNKFIEGVIHGLMDNNYMYPNIHDILKTTNNCLTKGAGFGSSVLAKVFHLSVWIGVFSFSFKDHLWMSRNSNKKLQN